MKKMKNLKMFAIAVMAFAVMAMGVHATSDNGDYTHGNCTTGCVASIGSSKFKYLVDAIGDANSGDTIKLLANVSSSVGLGTTSSVYAFDSSKVLDKELTINIGSHELDLSSAGLFVGENGSLTITGVKGGKVTTASTDLFTVKDGGSVVTKGAIELAATTSGAIANVNNGKVAIGDEAKLTFTTNAVVIGANGAEVSLKANAGVKGTPIAAGILVDASAVTADSDAKVTIEGGAYYLKNVMTIPEGLTVVVNAGTFTTSARAFEVSGGSLTINNGTVTVSNGEAVTLNSGNFTLNNGTIKTTNTNGAAIYTTTSGEGSLTINGGSVIATNNYALYFTNGELTYKIAAGEFSSKKDTSAIYIDDTLLEGLEEGGEDNFKGILTGGKYLYSIVGGTKNNEHKAAGVVTYIVAEGLEVRTEGNYKVLGNGASLPSDTPSDEPGDTTIPPVPQTNDNILVYAGLGLVSLASVAFTTRKRED